MRFAFSYAGFFFESVTGSQLFDPILAIAMTTGIWIKSNNKDRTNETEFQSCQFLDLKPSSKEWFGDY